ncbi:hypothetical protein AAFN88_12690 [Pelagibius sp. CAU 1746]|uniref:hypothetical protein n=1 Tax=Pelagibius sp. CAU 1746 TaxID=3140370 RepID=UPI00325ACA45
MIDDASPSAVGEAAGEAAGGPPVPARAEPAFTIRNVPLPTAEERRARRAAMKRAIELGAAPYRDAEGKARYVVFKDANNAPVEAWTRDREAKRGYRRTQYARKAAGQMAWHPEDQIELAKRLGVIYHREGRSVEGAAERGLYDAIWRYEHVWDSFTVPRRIGGGSAVQIIDTGRIAAVAEEEARKLQAEDPRAIGGFWVRDRKNNGLIYVVPNPDPEAAVQTREETIAGMGEDDLLVRTAAGESDAAGGTTEPEVAAAAQAEFDPSDVPELVGTRQIVDFIAERIKLSPAAFRQAAFESGLDPERAEFFRDLLAMTPETRDELIDRVDEVFGGDSSYLLVRSLLDQVSRTKNPEIRKQLIEGEARYARPVDPNEEIGLSLALPLIAGRSGGKGKPEGKAGRKTGRKSGLRLEDRFVLPPQERKINWNRDLAAPERRSFPDTGTTLYSVPNQPVAEWVRRTGRPLGFRSNEDYRRFIGLLDGKVTELDPKARIAMRGSAINGLSYEKGGGGFSRHYFDMKVEKASDFDIAIVSPELLKLARQEGIRVSPRNGGWRTGPLNLKEPLERLGLQELWENLTEMSGNRDVSFMIYESVEQLERRGTMMLLR